MTHHPHIHMIVPGGGFAADRSRWISCRPRFLAASGAAAAVSVLRPWRAWASPISEYRLVARPGHAHLVGGSYPETAVWGYNDKVPGPEIRVRQGERLRVSVENRLAEETTVHWHGLRVPNAMDGVPHLTQKPIAPGETFVCEFDEVSSSSVAAASAWSTTSTTESGASRSS